MVTLNAIEEKTYRDLLSSIAKRPQGSKVHVRDLFGIDRGQPTNPRIARRLYEEVAAGLVRLRPLGQRSSEGYLIL